MVGRLPTSEKQVKPGFLIEQVKPGFTNYQPRGLDNQIKFEV